MTCPLKISRMVLFCSRSRAKCRSLNWPTSSLRGDWTSRWLSLRNLNLIVAEPDEDGAGSVGWELDSVEVDSDLDPEDSISGSLGETPASAGWDSDDLTWVSVELSWFSIELTGEFDDFTSAEMFSDFFSSDSDTSALDSDCLTICSVGDISESVWVTSVWVESTWFSVLVFCVVDDDADMLCRLTSTVGMWTVLLPSALLLISSPGSSGGEFEDTVSTWIKRQF